MDVVTAIVAVNSLLSLVIIYFLLPMWKMRGELDGICAMLDTHEARIQSLEQSGRGK
jgi:hypothetical protein